MKARNTTACYKVILIGNCRVGKTSLLNNIIGKTTNHNNPIAPTIGVEYAPITIKANSKEDVKVNIWDTSGAEKYKSITASYYRKCQGAIIMFDITDKKTFIDLKMWMQELKKMIGNKLSKILLANKIDLVESGEKERQVPEEDIVDFCLDNELEFKYTSAVSGYNTKQSFNWFIEKIHEERTSKGRENSHSESSEFLKQNSIVSNIEISKQKVIETGPTDHLNCSKCC